MKGTTTEAELVQQKTKNGELQPLNRQAKSSLMNCVGFEMIKFGNSEPAYNDNSLDLVY